MHFLFPEAWYLLPLVVIPFLVNLQKYLNRQTLIIPSLFFLEKLLRRKRLHRQPRFWELLVELFFLLGLIFLLSRPVFAGFELGHNRLLVLLDDSPSMKYYFIRSSNPFFEKISTLLKKKYEQIDILPLSQLDKREPFHFTNPKDIEKFYRLLPNLKGNWSAEKVGEFFRNPDEQRLYRDYDFIIYSDHKVNHFQKLIEDFPPLFPSLLNVIDLPPTPVLLKAELNKDNFFVKEMLEMLISVDPGQDSEVFLVVAMDGETVFRKHVSPDSAKKGSIEFDIKFPVSAPTPASASLSIRRISVTLEKSGIAFQEITRVVNVYTPKTITLLPPQHIAVDFFQTLFAYDIERGNLALTPNPNNADTLILLDPSYIPTRIPSRKILFFISPDESSVLLNQILKKWGVTSFNAERKKSVGVLDKLETPYLKKTQSVAATEFNFKNYFFFDFLTPPDFTAVTIQKQPVIFRSGNFGVFNGIALGDMIREVNPEHLVWVYEVLFSFWGKKTVRYSTFGENDSNTKIPSSFHNQDEEILTVYTPQIEEFTSPSDPKRWGRISPRVIDFEITDENKDYTGDFSVRSISNTQNILESNILNSTTSKRFEIPWVEITVLIEILLLGLITYAFLNRIRGISTLN